MPPRPEQENEALVTMREDRDCAVAAVATACKVSYKKAHKALWHFNLPWILESPLLSNPLNVERGIKSLGFSVRQAKITELLNGSLPGGKYICLVHNPASAVMGTLESHWVVYMGQEAEQTFLFHWGKSQNLTAVQKKDLIEMLTVGWPNVILCVEKKY
ncbi:MAG: hypothetical protein EOM80_18855 [Erysipelotrichia bacterium]|nr:hypothetical protein [Erysipelotrichia bacterium]